MNCKKMKYLIIIFLLIISGGSLNAQNENIENKKSSTNQDSKTIVRDGFLISFEGIDVSKYELDVEDFNVAMVTLDHLLCLSTDECDLELTKELLKRGANANFKCEEVDDLITNVSFCIENGVEITKLLLEKGANINGADQDNDSFLAYAISNDNLDLVRYLIQKGADKLQRDTNRNMGCLPIHGCESIEMIKWRCCMAK